MGCDGVTIEASALLMEYAPYGDFFDLVLTDKIIKPEDDALIRTYFHQLINGVEAIHSSQVYHLDIKLENVLLGSDF
eukprot:CAMPEP_0114582114 /NCGR_PEP_ID=MMETSP0125-20121206/6150_1 /TAXON_ID=485358 ORGANISM="Aristerostoma sp., Strain ATCC 50986" /NCGR_SAMPLE_ID=MMETSP0125 /ASSEMBLY_ACC=CAM_ASM_000245 /LENGTH=76 /DNA_ID=CAMNT_0001774853 /DNA_START=343 /DNA_END=573 /DNA_ORIENTATION=+